MTENLQNAVEREGLVPCRQRSLMIVDDESSLRNVFKMVISMEMPDLQIDLAEDGVQALEAFREYHHAVLLMDLRMPVMDGRQAFLAIESLCGRQKWEMPAVIFCSGYAPPDVIRRVVSSNPSHRILPKPVSNELLIATVRSRLSL